MNADRMFKICETVRGSHTGTMTFPQIIMQLSELGVERYHADYSRQEKTYYLLNGESIVVPLPCENSTIADEFSASRVESAVRQSQRGEHTYPDFLQKTMAAGCVGYFAQVTGRRVIYFGRNGESHLEMFPNAPAEQ